MLAAAAGRPPVGVVALLLDADPSAPFRQRMPGSGLSCALLRLARPPVPFSESRAFQTSSISSDGRVAIVSCLLPERGAKPEEDASRLKLLLLTPRAARGAAAVALEKGVAAVAEDSAVAAVALETAVAAEGCFTDVSLLPGLSLPLLMSRLGAPAPAPPVAAAAAEEGPGEPERGLSSLLEPDPPQSCLGSNLPKLPLRGDTVLVPPSEATRVSLLLLLLLLAAAAAKGFVNRLLLAPPLSDPAFLLPPAGAPVDLSASPLEPDKRRFEPCMSDAVGRTAPALCWGEQQEPAVAE